AAKSEPEHGGRSRSGKRPAGAAPTVQPHARPRPSAVSARGRGPAGWRSGGGGRAVDPRWGSGPRAAAGGARPALRPAAFQWKAPPPACGANPQRRFPMTTPTPLDARLIESTTAALEMFGVYLGDRLGLYAALGDGKPVTAAELAARAGIHPRYAREWLEQQAVAGVLAVEDPGADADRRRFRLPAEHVGVLVDPEDGAHLAPLARMLAGIGRALEEVVAAYRSG